MGLKAKLKRFLPVRVQYLYPRLCAERIQRQYQSLELDDVFTRIYEAGAWGPIGADGMPNSGSGSRGRYIEEWVSLIEGPLNACNVATVADLGCGDFTVAAAIARMGYHVIGVDIARATADWSARFPSEGRVAFVRADLTTDPLPAADAAVVRQVLQHLNNAEVESALTNILRAYPLVFVTEHVYEGPGFVPNVDMPHGPGTRVPMLSGVFIDRPPSACQQGLWATSPWRRGRCCEPGSSRGGRAKTQN